MSAKRRKTKIYPCRLWIDGRWVDAKQLGKIKNGEGIVEFTMNLPEKRIKLIETQDEKVMRFLEALHCLESGMKVKRLGFTQGYYLKQEGKYIHIFYSDDNHTRCSLSVEDYNAKDWVNL